MELGASRNIVIRSLPDYFDPKTPCRSEILKKICHHFLMTPSLEYDITHAHKHSEEKDGLVVAADEIKSYDNGDE